MRRRSGGIHSNSQQQFVQLADIAQQCSSLFYDEHKANTGHKRRKYAFSAGPIEVNVKSEPKGKEKQAKNNKMFQNFDFDQQSYNYSKDCEQLKIAEKEISNLSQKSHFVIISSRDVHQTTTLLSHELGMYRQFSVTPERVLNLFVHKYFSEENNMLYIDCYWVVDITKIIMYGSLLDVYISKCSQLLDLTLPNQENIKPDSSLETTKSAMKTMVSAIHQKRLFTNNNIS